MFPSFSEVGHVDYRIFNVYMRFFCVVGVGGGRERGRRGERERER